MPEHRFPAALVTRGQRDQYAKVGLIVLGVVALGIFLADQAARTPHRQFDPWFVLIMLVIGIIVVLAAPAGRENGPHD